MTKAPPPSVGVGEGGGGGDDLMIVKVVMLDVELVRMLDVVADEAAAAAAISCSLRALIEGLSRTSCDEKNESDRLLLLLLFGLVTLSPKSCKLN
jgi:hypothetical protein